MCRIETTVGKIRVGSKLMFGQYGVTEEQTYPIMWFKATPNCDFISVNVLDYICFDARERAAGYNERMYGNADYERSNIVLFINSEDKDWWHKTHECDLPPDGNNVCLFRDAYHSHCGFLHHFEEYEIGSLVPIRYQVEGKEVASLMRLPAYSDLVGADRFQLFTRRGIRARGTEDYIISRGMYSGFDENSYIEFWLSNLQSLNYPAILTRNGDMWQKPPYLSAGLRPVCTIKPETVLEADDNKLFWVKQQPNDQRELFSEDEFFRLLGIARP